MSRRLVSPAAALGLVVLAAAACKPKQTGEGTTAPLAPSDPTTPAPSAEGTPAETDSAGASTPKKPTCGDKGTSWDGSHAGCTYEHAGCCYPDPASLCAAAGCADDDCRILESRPAQAACK
ncbi:MAG: hypothetical protein AAF721_23270 [Myxococcota bacterium]